MSVDPHPGRILLHFQTAGPPPPVGRHVVQFGVNDADEVSAEERFWRNSPSEPVRAPPWLS